MGKQWKQCQTLFLGGSKITADGGCSHEIKTLTPWKESYDQPRQHIKKQRQYFANKDQSWVFTGRTDVEAETPILWPPHAKS